MTISKRVVGHCRRNPHPSRSANALLHVVSPQMYSEGPLMCICGTTSGQKQNRNVPTTIVVKCTNFYYLVLLPVLQSYSKKAVLEERMKFFLTIKHHSHPLFRSFGIWSSYIHTNQLFFFFTFHSCSFIWYLH